MSYKLSPDTVVTLQHLEDRIPMKRSPLTLISRW